MTATNHALTGVVIALAIKQPLLAIPLAFATHFAMDAVPHFDAGPDHVKQAKIVAFSDSAIAGITLILLSIFLNSSIAPWLIFACGFACMSPDLEWGWRYYKFKDFKKVVSGKPISWFTTYHLKIQRSETRPGAFVELAWLAGISVVILLLK